MKLQAPTSKLQRKTKLQTPIYPEGRKTRSLYADGPDSTSLLNETPHGNGKTRHPFDLEERTSRFGEAIIGFAKKIPRGPVNNRLIDQLVGCGTSVGGNYCEANEGISKKDFRCVIGRCVKEAKETKFFLRMIATAEPELNAEARDLFREAKELHLIFASIYRK
ncbi:MAG TPA: four helix bundle protein [Chthoniobacterales bacterium]|nr:four helix bundle protein [Chthoniobacterales bacterium]